jgi:hypothetical protein
MCPIHCPENQRQGDAIRPDKVYTILGPNNSGGETVKTTLRLNIAIAALSTAGFGLAAPGDPPTDGIDLGSMKLKPRVAAPAANVVGAAAPAPSLIPRPAGTPVSTTPTVVGGTAPVQSAPQNTAAPSNTASTTQSGIGTIVTAPIGSKKAIDILAAPVSSKPAQATEDKSADVQVKMPSMFRK